MIGVFAAQEPDAVAPGGGLPENATAFADFINGVYLYGESELTAAAVISNPERIGVFGLALTPGQSTVDILGDFEAFLIAANWTVLIDLTVTSPTASSDILFVSKLGSITYFVKVVVYATHGRAIDGAPFHSDRNIFAGTLSPGRHKIAVTRTDAKLVISVDASAIASDTNNQPTAGFLTDAAFGGISGSTISQSSHIRSLTLYAPQDDGVLPTLSSGFANEALPNDNFANAITISVGDTIYASNFTATKQSGEPNHAGNAGGASVWWKFVAPATASYHIDLSGSDFDTTLGVYTGAAVGALSTIASDDDSGAGSTSALSFSATSGVTYYIAVDGYDGVTGTIVMALTAV